MVTGDCHGEGIVLRLLSSCRRIVVLRAPLLALAAHAGVCKMPPARYTPNVDQTNAAYWRPLARLAFAGDTTFVDNFSG